MEQDSLDILDQSIQNESVDFHVTHVQELSSIRLAIAVLRFDLPLLIKHKCYSEFQARSTRARSHGDLTNLERRRCVPL
jgi:hypothetical protein